MAQLDFSKKRKELQEINEAPDWYTTAGVQLFYDKYSYEEESPRSRYSSIAKAMAQHAPKKYPDWWKTDPYTKGKNWEQVFFDTMWQGFISPSTPMLGNGGLRKRGTTVSCAGSTVSNNLYSRYNVITESAVLTKHSHGTSCSVDEWPHEGAPLKRGGLSGGVMPVIRDLITTMEEVVQGHRRGSLSYSISPYHGDFPKVLSYLFERPESNNPGWLISDVFSQKLLVGEEKESSLLAEMLAVKLMRGKGYFTFIDKMNRHLAYPFKRKGMTVKATNLCTETCLPADDDYTFSCVILNYNLELYRQWPEHLVFIGQVMSDCNVSEYLATMDEMTPQDKQAMAKIYRFTEEFRALGSGVLGFHTLLQKERIVVGSLESFYINDEIFRGMRKQGDDANSWLAKVLGEPLGCKGLGLRNATMFMMPPTKSTAEIMAGASEGIGLDMAMAFTKQSSAGEFFRVNKVLLELMKERGIDFDSTVRQIVEERGSVQNREKFSWLTEHERAVFRTGFEAPMELYLDLCFERQKYIDQAQSINLYLTSADSEEYIAALHRKAFEDERCLSLYYCYSMRNSGAITRVFECENCQ